MDFLPVELWTKVFSYVPRYRDLIKCQLVCKRWNHPAETAMFTKGTAISSEKQLIQVCDHLDEDPTREKLVPSLRIYTASNYVERLIRLAFNLNTKHICGQGFQTNEIYQLMDSIVKDSKIKFNKLCRIVYFSNIPPGPCYYAFLLNFTDTLKTLDLNTIDLCHSDNLFMYHCLDKFINVSELLLKVTPSLTIQELDAILNKLPNLRQVVFDIEDGSAPIPASHQVTFWANATTKICNNMQHVDFGRCLRCRPDMIEYFAFKYPNANNFLLGLCVMDYRDCPKIYNPASARDWTVSNLFRTLAALRKLRL